MTCFDSSFISDFKSFILNQDISVSDNRYLVFSVATFIFSMLIFSLNLIVDRLFSVKVLQLKLKEKKDSQLLVCLLWALGAFLMALILSISEIINVKMISAVLIAFTWNKMFIDLYNKMSSRDDKENPNSNLASTTDADSDNI